MAGPHNGQGWVSANTPPKDWAGVWAFAAETEYIYKAHVSEGRWCHYRGGEPIEDTITHWMEPMLPAPPTGDAPHKENP